MKVSATEEHGLRCLMHLAEAHAQRRTATIAEISAARGMTPAYVAKIIGLLRRGGLVRTSRGSRGGLRLARPPEAVTLAEALSVLSGQPVRLRPCVEDDLGRDCGWEGPCGLRDVWRTLNGHIREVLEHVTIASLTRPDGAPPRPGLPDPPALPPSVPLNTEGA